MECCSSSQLLFLATTRTTLFQILFQSRLRADGTFRRFEQKGVERRKLVDLRERHKCCGRSYLPISRRILTILPYNATVENILLMIRIPDRPYCSFSAYTSLPSTLPSNMMGRTPLLLRNIAYNYNCRVETKTRNGGD
jgi:hypothetical protein